MDEGGKSSSSRMGNISPYEIDYLLSDDVHGKLLTTCLIH